MTVLGPSRCSLCGYDHLDGGWRSVAQRVPVDVDALDDAAVLGAIHPTLFLVSLVLCRVAESPGPFSSGVSNTVVVGRGSMANMLSTIRMPI